MAHQSKAPRRDRLRSDGAHAVEPGKFAHAEPRSRGEREGQRPRCPTWVAPRRDRFGSHIGCRGSGVQAPSGRDKRVSRRNANRPETGFGRVAPRRDRFGGTDLAFAAGSLGVSEARGQLSKSPELPATNCNTAVLRGTFGEAAGPVRTRRGASLPVCVADNRQATGASLFLHAESGGGATGTLPPPFSARDRQTSLTQKRGSLRTAAKQRKELWGKGQQQRQRRANSPAVAAQLRDGSFPARGCVPSIFSCVLSCPCCFPASSITSLFTNANNVTGDDAISICICGNDDNCANCEQSEKLSPFPFPHENGRRAFSV